MLEGLRDSSLRYKFVGGVYDPGRRGLDRTALQRHVDFFDGNSDGVLTIRELKHGLDRLEIGPGVLRLALSVAVCLILGRRTWKVVYPTTTINVDAIHRGRHGSSTGIFTARGEVDTARFDAKFAQYDTDHDDKLSHEELERWMKEKASPGLHQALDRFFAQRELPVLMEEFGEPLGETTVLTRAVLLEFYSGSLFPKLADKIAQRR